MPGATTRWLLSGNPERLLRKHMRFQPGWRGSLQRTLAAAELGRYTDLGPTLKVHWDRMCRGVEVISGRRVTDAAMIDTSWYKSHQFLGIVRTSSDARFFVRHHASQSEAEAERNRWGKLHSVVRDMVSVDVPALVGQHDASILYELVLGASVPPKERDLLVHVGDSIDRYSSDRAVHATLQERLGSDLPHPLRRTARALDESARGATEFRIAHGDLTTWNMLKHRERGTVLLDFEHVGLYPRYFDLVHGLLQTHLLSSSGAVRALESIRGYVPESLIGAGCLYSMLRDYRDARQFPDNAGKLHRDVSVKGELVDALLHARRRRSSDGA